MIAAPRSRRSRKAVFFGVMWIAFSLFAPAPARAGGAQPLLPAGSSLKPGEPTPIQLASEAITIDIRPATAADNNLVQLNPEFYTLDFDPTWFPAVAETKAEFRFRNPTGQAAGATAWFPLSAAPEELERKLMPGESLPRLANLRVSLDGKAMDYSVSEQAEPRDAEKPARPWASFPIHLPAGGETTIQVSYAFPLQLSGAGGLPLSYAFQAAAGWAGPIEQVELTLNLPYPASQETLAGLPAGATLAGNQAVWTWQDFEPGSGANFSAGLLPPGNWQDVEKARQATLAKPQDGQAWLDLAGAYYAIWGANLDFPANYPPVFGPVYLSKSIQASLEAARLLPEHPGPRAGLGLLLLAPYIKEQNAPPEVIQYALDELRVARELASRHPELAEAKSLAWWWSVKLERALKTYPYDDPAGLAAYALTATVWAIQTATEAPPEIRTAPPTPEPTALASPPALAAAALASKTPGPAEVDPQTPTQVGGNRLDPGLILGAALAGLAILVGLAFILRSRGRNKRNASISNKKS